MVQVQMLLHSWREAIQWLDTRANVPGLINRSLYVTGDQDSDEYINHALNVRNFGDGDEGDYNVDENGVFEADSQDGTLGSANYWYKISYLNEPSMAGEKGPDPDHLYYHFVITSIANGTQRVDVTVRKLFKVGQNL